MSAFTRLWARAPLWRTSLILAGTLSVLVALYPPGAMKPTRTTPASPAPSPTPPTASYTASPGAPTAAFGESRRTSVRVGGRELPLPPGEWTVVARIPLPLGDGEVAESIAAVRVTQKTVSALALFVATRSEAPSRTGFRADPSCERSDVHYVRVAANADRGRQDCWLINYTLTAAWTATGELQTLRAAAGELRFRELDLPHTMPLVQFRLASAEHLVVAAYYFNPELEGVPPSDATDASGSEWSKFRISAHPANAAYIGRLKEWGIDWWPIVRDAFAGRLAPGPWVDRNP